MKTLAILILAAAAPQESDHSRILKKIDSMKITVDFKSTPIREAIDYVREITALNIVIDARVGEAAEKEIRLRVRDLSVRSILKLMFRSAGLQGVLRDGAIVVMNEDDVKAKMVTRVYDVRDLLLAIRDFPGPSLELNYRKPGIIVSCFCDCEGFPPQMTADFILDLIQQSCGWKDEGDSGLTENNGLIVVRHNSRVQRQVSALLGQLRKFK